MSFACVLHFAMSSSAFHLHVFQNLHPFRFSRFSLLSVRSPDHSRAPVAPLSDLVSCAGVKRSQDGPRFAKRPWYTTGRPPVKFRAIWRSFGSPTVNRVTVKASFSLQPKTPSKVAQNPSNSPPCSRSFDHDRVAENRTSFGHS